MTGKPLTCNSGRIGRVIVVEESRKPPRPKRQSIAATYDSRVTGPAYHVTTRLGDRTIEFERPAADPFVCHTVHVGRTDLLAALDAGGLDVTVIVGAHPDRVEDVLELDANQLGYNCTRRDEFNAGISRAIVSVAGSHDPEDRPELN